MASSNSSTVRVTTVVGGKKALASRTSQPKLITVRVDTGSESCSTRTIRELEVSDDFEVDTDDEQPHPVLNLSSTSDENSDSSSSIGKFKNGLRDYRAVITVARRSMLP